MAYKRTLTYVNQTGTPWATSADELKTTMLHADLNKVLINRNLWTTDQIYLESDIVDVSGNSCTKVYIYSDHAYEIVKTMEYSSGTVDDVMYVTASDFEYLPTYDLFDFPLPTNVNPVTLADLEAERESINSEI